MESDRMTRAAMYATWIVDDVNGLMTQLERPHPDQAKILVDARRNVKAALELIEHRLKIQKVMA